MKKSTNTDPRSSCLLARYLLDYCAHLLSGSERSMLRSRSIEAQFYAVKNSSGITTWCLLSTRRSTRRSFVVRGTNDPTQSSASQDWLENSTIRDSTELCNYWLNEDSSPTTPGA
jgi:hypothetical protein